MVAKRRYRLSDAAISDLHNDFRAHIAEEKLIPETLARLEQSVACLDKRVEELQGRVPQLSETIKRWSQARGIFWLIFLAVMAATGTITTADWLLVKLKAVIGMV